MEEIVADAEVKGTEQARRWCFTINNPFGEDVEEVDILTTTLPIKEDYYSADIIKDFEDSGYFKFKFVKIELQDGDFNSKEYVICRPYFKDVESAMQYFQCLESFRYCIFQLEQGEEGTKHLQGFIMFHCGKRFRTIKKMLPMAHIEKARGSNTQNRAYCSKKDTRVEGPFEVGKFAEEGARSDIKEFLELVKAGTDRNELSRLYPSLLMKEVNKLDALYSIQFDKYKYECRDVKVTYIYGESGIGKSSMMRRKLGTKEAFWVHNYDNSMFTHYNYQDSLVFDEFTDKLPIGTLNMYLNVEPIELRGLNCVKYGAYHNVYFISNYSPKELYAEIQRERPDIFKTFYRRLNTIIRIDKEGNEHYERITEWEDCDNEIDRSMGIKLQTSKVYDIDEDGNKKLVFDRHKPKDLEIVE
ncbi:MAG: hypothetical protein IJZ77_06190, partial [Bacilli bacterium]|nr:hypothetical protein [Bacilli bacterium]